jgi:hypothetical protein
MTKKLSFIVLLVKFTFSHAQVTDHILFKVKDFDKTEDVSSFKLRYTDVTLVNKQANHKNLHVFNLYFSCGKPLGGAFNKSRYSVSTLKYNELSNDLLITITPLTDSLELKMIKLDKNEFTANLAVYTAQQLLDDAVKRLYNEFTRRDISNQNTTPSNLRTMRFKLIVQRGEEYYKYNGPILTEFYLIDHANYLFPSQYHFGEINMIGNEAPFFTRKDISNLDKKFPSTTQNDEFPRDAISQELIPVKKIQARICFILNTTLIPVSQSMNGSIGGKAI